MALSHYTVDAEVEPEAPLPEPTDTPIAQTWTQYVFSPLQNEVGRILCDKVLQNLKATLTGLCATVTASEQLRQFVPFEGSATVELSAGLQVLTSKLIDGSYRTVVEFDCSPSCMSNSTVCVEKDFACL